MLQIKHDALNSKALTTINRVLSEAGYSVRIVGGAVRDMLQGKTPKDFDIATDAQPHVVAAAFEVEGIAVIETGLQHGTVTVVIDHVGYEITTLRIDAETDGRHAKVEYTTDWFVDSCRRDLTINAMSMDFDGNVFDYHNGVKDLKEGRIAFVGDASTRIQEDYLRILRYFRFAAKLMIVPGFWTDQIVAVRENCEGLKQISVERIWMEMQKIVVAPNAIYSLREMDQVGVLNVLGIDTVDYVRFEQTQSDNPITKMVALTGLHMDFLPTIWKMSSDEMKLAQFLMVWHHSELDAKAFQRLIAVGRSKFSHIEELAKLKQFNLKTDEIERARNAVFPINGDDLLAKGLRGVEVGKAMDKLRNAWMDSQFQMTKEQLLGSL